MSLDRSDILRELGLLPVWKQRESGMPVAQATSPAGDKLIQGEHDRGYLPHLKAENGIYFVTFRLMDSLPAEMLDQLEDIPEQERSRAVEKWLDQGHGECLLSQPGPASILAEAIISGQNDEYRLHAWVVMPNHVHMVMEPLPGKSLTAALQRIKSWTAHEINQRTARSGGLWQRESYDHLIRDEDEFARCCEYVRQNPVKAGLAETPESFAYCDTGWAYAGEAACATESGAVTVAQAASPATVEPVQDAALALDRRELIQRMDWTELKTAVAACEACSLAQTRTQTVFGVGDEQAEWMFVGEAPGAEEDKRGEPFVGQAGKLLDNMLAAIKLKRGENVYIANVLKCRPPQNRDPHGEEVVRCDPFLKRQVELIKPRLIVALGKFAAQSLLGGDPSIASLRGKLHDYHGVPLIVTYHPAYLLRNLPDKAKAWEDLCFARATMRELLNK